MVRLGLWDALERALVRRDEGGEAMPSTAGVDLPDLEDDSSAEIEPDNIRAGEAISYADELEGSKQSSSNRRFDSIGRALSSWLQRRRPRHPSGGG